MCFTTTGTTLVARQNKFYIFNKLKNKVMSSGFVLVTPTQEEIEYQYLNYATSKLGKQNPMLFGQFKSEYTDACIETQMRQYLELQEREIPLN